MTPSVRTLIQYRKTLREYLNELVSLVPFRKTHIPTPFLAASYNAIPHATRPLPYPSTTQDMFVLCPSGRQVRV